MILDLVFPKWCLVCQRIGCYLCYRCAQKLEYVEIDGCLYCDKVTVSGRTHERCQRKYGLDGCQAFLYYSPEVKRIVKELKYSQIRDAYHEIFWSLRSTIVAKIAFFRRNCPDMYIQPLPLHNRRLQARGFNQAEILSRSISQLTGIPLLDCLERVKDTPQQARQGSRWHRYLNIRHAFSVKNTAHMKGKSVLLFDDVITTGSTVKEACATLKKHGAAAVFALSLARD